MDLESAGNINGVPVFEFDIDSLTAEDKPWRKPGYIILCIICYHLIKVLYTRYS